jgi:serine/threonine protein kinase
MSHPSWIGRKLGNRYEIEELLGQGGMSAVYKATDPNLRRTVAVKLIHSHLSGDPAFLSRFEEEAAAVAQLKHPNLIQVFDFDRDNDVYYMILEFVPGETLQERLRRLNASNRNIDFEEVIAVTAGVCDALDYAHNRGMIHRDVKPANIMVDVHGQAILMDFGIAKIVGGKQHTASGAVIDTARYMSPEQIRGEQPDARVDIYAVGVTLFEMLSGHPPFEADSAMTTMMMHINDPVPDLLQSNANTPAALAAVVNRALEKDRNRRFGSAAEMAAALRAIDLQAPDIQAPVADGRDLSATMIDPVNPVHPEEDITVNEPPQAPVAIPAQTPQVPSPSPSPAPPAGQSAPQAPPAALKNRRTLLIGGGILAAVIVCGLLGFGGYSLYRNLGENRLAADPTSALPVTGVEPSATVQAISPTEAPLPTATDEPPTEIPTLAPIPTATDPGGLYARINQITIDSGRYIVDYETFGYTEELPGMHVHFFFDTVTQEQAGVPGSGPWILYGGPRPFTQYTPDHPHRTSAATSMCALVANSDHSILRDSGNCVSLPDL